MNGSLLDLARNDARKFLISGGFQVDITLSTPKDDKTLSLKGFHTKHFKSYDTNGSPINSKSAHILISEKDLKEANYPYRNSRSGNIGLLKHKITVPDAMGDDKKFVITETYPSETFGLIACILGDYAE
jgi:hypothetical protein